MKVHLREMDQLDEVLDHFPAVEQTTTSFVPTTPVFRYRARQRSLAIVGRLYGELPSAHCPSLGIPTPIGLPDSAGQRSGGRQRLLPIHRMRKAPIRLPKRPTWAATDGCVACAAGGGAATGAACLPRNSVRSRASDLSSRSAWSPPVTSRLPVA